MADKINIAPWLRASLEDFNNLDFEAPLIGSISADCYELSQLFLADSQQGDGSATQEETASNRVMIMLSSIAGMHFKPQERNEPFGPMMMMDGRRSAIISDFRAHVELLADLAVRATNPVLRARLSDICWLLERKRTTLAASAISAYVEIVEKTEKGELKYRYAPDGGALQHNNCDYLRRALQIGRAFGWDKPETISALELVKRLREQAIAERALGPIRWFCDLDLNFAVSDASNIGDAIESVLMQPLNDANLHFLVDLWKLAARAFHIARREDDKNRCLSEAAETLVAESQAKQGSAMLAAHFLSCAIAQLHGLPGKKDRRTELRHQLINLQARASEEEMSRYSEGIDIGDIVQYVQDKIGEADLFDMLFIFANLAQAPDPKKLVDDAVVSIGQNPLTSSFGTSHLDREGKVIYRSQGGGIGDGSDNSAVLQWIAQAEDIRRKLVAYGKVETARLMINDQYYVSEDTFVSLLQYSPFVPNYLIQTFARGFMRFFQGDFVSATYILTPLLENSLRHVLKLFGEDVTIFDDATQTQQDRTISSLFESMRNELDEKFTLNITADIERLFLNKPGPQLRHDVAHGLMDDGDPYGSDAIYACWLIFRLCLLPLMQHQKELRADFNKH